MRSITFEGKKINFDFSLGCINDVYVNELKGDFNDLVNMQEYQNDPQKLIAITRDILLSGHIYWLFLNNFDEQAEELLAKLKGAKMVATKWLVVAKVVNVVDWITEDLMPSDLEKPAIKTDIKKKK
jgi:hypothetical protein